MSEAAADPTATDQRVLVDYRSPFDWAAIRGFLSARAVAGVEVVDGDRYARTVRFGESYGSVALEPAGDRDALLVTIVTADPSVVPEVIGRVRAMFDVDADVATISTHLASDPLLAPLVAARPGLRVPTAWDPFELAIRAILGQQVTVVAARTLAGRLVAELGEPLSGAAQSREPGLTTLFPSPPRLSDPERIGRLGMPRARARTIVALAAAVAADPTLLILRPDRSETIARLTSLPGVGDWTAEYIALRGLRDPDAFPAGDVGLLRTAALEVGRRVSADELRRRSLRWRPWRAYAAQHLWSAPPEESSAAG